MIDDVTDDSLLDVGYRRAVLDLLRRRAEETGCEDVVVSTVEVGKAIGCSRFAVATSLKALRALHYLSRPSVPRARARDEARRLQLLRGGSQRTIYRLNP
jgi:hypothetical protein